MSADLSALTAFVLVAGFAIIILVFQSVDIIKKDASWVLSCI